MTGTPWHFEDVAGIHLLRCSAIEAVSGLTHAFSTRVAFGRTDFDLGPPSSADPGAHAARAAFMTAVGFGDASPAPLRQVHGGVIVDAADGTASGARADGVVWFARRGLTIVPAVCTADCVAVLVVDRRGGAAAALHAGWRGVAAGIGAAAVERFAADGIPGASLVVGMGPAILGCCYEVGKEVPEALRDACGPPDGYVERGGSGRTTVDLHAALRAQLVAAGVPAFSIHAAPWCTRCHNDRFFSVRAEGPAAGRLMAAVGPARRA